MNKTCANNSTEKVPLAEHLFGNFGMQMIAD